MARAFPMIFAGTALMLASVACGPAYDVPFVVRRGVAQGDIAVVVNTNTWNAYNPFGGRS